MIATLKIPSELYRTANIRVKGGDGAGKIRLSISSDEPYKRWDWDEGEYWEVLDHSPGGLKDERLNGGMSFLYNHNRDIILGRSKGYECDGHKCYIEPTLSKAQAVRSYIEQIEEGTLSDASIGYELVGKGKQIGEKDGLPIYKFAFRIFEASAVSIPADASVGMGRMRQKEKDSEPASVEISIESEKEIDETPKNENNGIIPENPSDKTPIKNHTMSTPTTEPTAPVIDVSKERNEAVAAERKRVADIQELQKHFAEKGLAGRKVDTSALASQMISEGKTVRDFQDRAVRSELPEIKPIDLENSGNIGLSKKEKASFSLLRACRLLALGKELDGLEREVSDAAEIHGAEKNPRGIYLPRDITEFDLSRSNEFNPAEFTRMLSRAQTAGVATAGGFTVQNQYGSMIELLRNATVLGRLGITQVNGLVGDFVMPVQTGGATFAWVSETGALSDSEATFGQKTMTPHRGGATTPYSTQFLAQTSLSAEQFFRNELMTATAIGVDLAGLEGTGVNGQPLGVKNTTGINATVTFGGAAVWADIIEFETGIVVDNADIGSMGFALSAGTVGKWKAIVKEASSGNGFLINDNNGLVNGYPYQRTNQITGDIAFFGVWRQLLHAMWATQEVIVDPYALKKSGQVEITLNTFHDFLVRQPLAFNVSTDSAAQ